MELLIGADPEIFVKKDGHFHSAHGLVPGTKEKPFAVPNGAVQVDGMALEFNIDPSETEDEFAEYISSVMQHLNDMTPGFDLSKGATADFTPEHLAEQPEEALILGCEPDFNAYTGKENAPPNAAATFRTAAGHIHIGWCKDVDPYHPEHIAACELLVKELDLRLALPFATYDKDNRRRELYGAPGAYRPKSYGVEYRVLSNAWLDSDELTRWVYRTVCDTFRLLCEGKSECHRYEVVDMMDQIACGEEDAGDVVNHANRWALTNEITLPPNLEE